MRKILKKIGALTLASCLAASMLVGCNESSNNGEKETTTADISKLTPEEYFNVASWDSQEYEVAKEDHYRNYYEVFVYSFADSDGDGIGDLNGLTSKLDYIEDLGFNGIWLMPIMKSTTYHKYDVVDYCSIDEEYGTMEDFEKLVDECHKRNINLIIDFVFNHTSSQHEWFKQAKSYYQSLAEGEKPDFEKCPYANYYNIKTKEEVGNASGYAAISGTDYKYECQFWSGMPDLNLDNPQVRKEIENIVDFWIEKGVDGFRLDAAKEYTTGNSEKNIEVLNWFENYVTSVKEDTYVVAEVWDSQAAIANYYTSGVESIFDYAFGNYSGILVKCINLMNGKNLAQRFEKVEATYLSNNAKLVNAPFASNHDTGRLAGFLSNNQDKVKIVGALNQIMSGCSFVYYGEEIGMSGSVAAKDENARTPMRWNNFAGGVNTVGPTNMDEIEQPFATLEEQMKDKNSIYWYYKNMLHIRRTYEEISKGRTTAIDDFDENALCVIRKTYEDKTMIIIANLGKEPKTITLSKDKYGYSDMVASLVTNIGDDSITIDGDNITIPAYGIAFLK